MEVKEEEKERKKIYIHPIEKNIGSVENIDDLYELIAGKLVLNPKIYEIVETMEWPMPVIDYDKLKERMKKSRQITLLISHELKDLDVTKTGTALFVSVTPSGKVVPARIGTHISLEEISAILIALAEQLEILHSMGKYHGDVSIDNVLVYTKEKGSTKPSPAFVYDQDVRGGSMVEDRKKFGILMWEFLHLTKYEPDPEAPKGIISLKFNKQMSKTKYKDIVEQCLHDKTLTTTQLIYKLKNAYVEEVIGKDNIHSISFWKQCFLAEPRDELDPPYQISWTKFQKIIFTGIATYYSRPSYVKLFKALLETKLASGRGVVKCNAFASFIGLFGDISPELEWFQQIEWAVANQWFFGKATRDEANAFLKKTYSHYYTPFLVRFYEKNPNHFTISFISYNKDTKKVDYAHLLIQRIKMGDKDHFIFGSTDFENALDQSLTLQHLFPSKFRRGKEMYETDGFLRDALEDQIRPGTVFRSAYDSPFYTALIEEKGEVSTYRTFYGIKKPS